MARKSRKNMHENKTENTKFKTAIYARLSSEKDNIENQINHCKNYIADIETLELTNTYIDNGYTGTNFNRPQFNLMMKGIKAGKINCVVVRDLSRFARDYIEAGEYIENIFPQLNVRFISVSENYDSEVDNKTSGAISVPLQNMINTLYAKDISRKVCSANKSRIIFGDYKRNNAPYGYKLSKDKTQLEIDEETVRYVKMIFELRAKELTIKQITEHLESIVAIPPSRKSAGKWHYTTVQNILKNHAYTGDTVIGKRVKAFYKGQALTEIKDKNKWTVLENTHEPIISKEMFLSAKAKI